MLSVVIVLNLQNWKVLSILWSLINTLPLRRQDEKGITWKQKKINEYRWIQLLKRLFHSEIINCYYYVHVLGGFISTIIMLKKIIATDTKIQTRDKCTFNESITKSATRFVVKPAAACLVVSLLMRCMHSTDKTENQLFATTISLALIIADKKVLRINNFSR